MRTSPVMMGTRFSDSSAHYISQVVLVADGLQFRPVADVVVHPETHHNEVAGPFDLDKWLLGAHRKIDRVSTRSRLCVPGNHGVELQPSRRLVHQLRTWTLLAHTHDRRGKLYDAQGDRIAEDLDGDRP